MINVVFETVAKINSIWSLTAFAIGTLLVVILSIRKKIRVKHAISIFFFIAFICSMPIIASTYISYLNIKTLAIYTVRVIVINPQNVPEENAIVWATFGGEAKKVIGGWELDIPAAKVSNERKLTIYAKSEDGFLTGEKEIQLKDDFKPATTIKLKKDESAIIRGIVKNQSGESIPEAKVSIVGHGKDAVRTDSSGSFVLSAYAAFGQEVRVRAEKENYIPSELYFLAGKDIAVFYLKKK